MNDEIENYREIIEALNHHDTDQFRNLYLDLHFYDQAQIFVALDAAQRQYVYRTLSTKELGDMFDELDEDEEIEIDYFKEMTPKMAANVLSAMYTDNAVDILGEMDKSDLSTYLNLMPKDEISEVRRLLNYDDKTAGSLMTTEYVVVDQEETVRQAMQAVRHKAQDAEVIYYVYVMDDEELLVGVVTLRELLMNDARTQVKDLMNENLYTVQVDDDQQDVAQKVRDYNFLAVPVINKSGHLLGIITVDDIIDVIDEESAEDYSGLAGVNVDDTEEPPFKAALHRLPWLITLLILGMSTASLINHFDGLVSQVSILAVFISLITGTAGNAGTQSLAIAVRKISFENDRKIWTLIGSEVVTGLLIGIVTGIVITIIVGVWKGNFVLGGIIGISMMAAITVANLAGSLIPIVMDRIGVDPAVASGPFISTVSDLTSVLIYFSIAQIFLSYLR